MVDYFWSGAWWYGLQLGLVEFQLDRALNTHGETSLIVRAYTERCRDLYFGLKYWRRQPRFVQEVFARAEQGGVPLDHLRLLALNRDITNGPHGLIVRSSWWMPILGYAALALMLAGWSMLTLMVLASGAAWSRKLLGLCILTLLWLLLWPGFGIYSTRAYRANRRSGSEVESWSEALCAPRGATVTKLAFADEPPRRS